MFEEIVQDGTKIRLISRSIATRSSPSRKHQSALGVLLPEELKSTRTNSRQIEIQDLTAINSKQPLTSESFLLILNTHHRQTRLQQIRTHALEINARHPRQIQLRLPLNQCQTILEKSIRINLAQFLNTRQKLFLRQRTHPPSAKTNPRTNS